MSISKSKKVLIFSFAYYPYVGGAEVAIKEVTDRLDSVEFDLITYNFLGKLATEEKIGNANIFRIKSFTKYLFPIKSFIKGSLLYRKNSYDTVWAVMANTGFAALFLKLLFPKIKFVLTIQEGDPIPQIKRRVWFVYPIFKMIFKLADHVTAISSYLADFAREMGAGSVEIVPNGVDLNKFKFQKEKLKVKDKKNVMLVTTGRLVKKNAVDDIIKALAILADNFFLKIVGSGEDEEMLRHLAKELDVSRRIQFTPVVSHEMLPSILVESDIFIRPSLTEGLGNSFLEAMAVGLPVIGTNVGGIPDFLKDGETGLFCKVRSPEDIAEKVGRLIESADLYQRVSHGGRKIVEEKYSWDMIAKKYGYIF